MIIPNNHKIFADIIHFENKNTGLFCILLGLHYLCK